MHPLWAPSLDDVADSVQMVLGAKASSRFERTAFYASKVRNVSSVGSHYTTGPSGTISQVDTSVPNWPFIPNILQVVVRPESPVREARHRGATRTPRVRVGGQGFRFGISVFSGWTGAKL